MPGGGGWQAWPVQAGASRNPLLVEELLAAGFVDDERVELIGVEAAGEGLETRRHSAPLTTGARGVLHGAMHALSPDEHCAGRAPSPSAVGPKSL